MMLFKQFLGLLCTSILFVSCGKAPNNEPYTLVSFGNSGGENQMDTIQSNLSGGIIIYAKHLGTGKVWSHYASSVSALTGSFSHVFLPNGDYRFYAYGYDASITSGGTFYCGIGNNNNVVPLYGGLVTVNLNLFDSSTAPSACLEHAANSGFIDGGLPLGLKIRHCFTSALCNTANPTASSVSLHLPAYNNLTGNDDVSSVSGAIGGCFSLPASGDATFASIIPLRFENRLIIRKYSDVACATLVSQFHLHDGAVGLADFANLASAGPAPSIFKQVISTNLYIFIKP